MKSYKQYKTQRKLRLYIMFFKLLRAFQELLRLGQATADLLKDFLPVAGLRFQAFWHVLGMVLKASEHFSEGFLLISSHFGRV